MAKPVKTFREMERDAYVKDVFTVLFVVACAVPLSQLLFDLMPAWLFGGVPSDAWGGVLYTAVKMVYAGLGVYVPFLVWQLVTRHTPGHHFTRAPEPYGATVAVCGVLGTACLGAAAFCASQGLCDRLVLDGYVLHERFLPAVSDAEPWTYGAFCVLAALVMPFFWELTFRGTVTRRLDDTHPVFAALVPAVLCAGAHISFLVLPFLFVTFLVSGAVWRRSHSSVLCYLCTAVATLVTAGLWSFSRLCPVAYAGASVFVAVTAAGVGAVCVALLLVRPRTGKRSDMTAREGCRAFFGSFALWILLVLVVFRFLFLYIDKPKPPEPDPPATEATSEL